MAVSLDTDGGGPLTERPQVDQRFDEIVVLKVLEGKSKGAPVLGGERTSAYSEVRGVLADEWRRTSGAGVNSMQHYSRKLSEELKRPADSLSDRRRRSAAKEELDAAPQEIVGKENIELQASWERLTSREKGTDMPDHRYDMEFKIEKVRADDSSLRDRVWNLEEEKGKLHKDLASMTLRETILREKVKEFELQMDGHRKRVERAEKTILELRESAAHSNKQARQAEADLEELRRVSMQKDGEKSDLQNLVDRLQQLCMDHEKSIHGLRQGLKNGMDGNKEGRMSRLQRELHRLSGVEINLQTELEASRGENCTLRREIKNLLDRVASEQKDRAANMKKVDHDFRAEIEQGQAQVTELKDENNLLFAKMRLVMRERQVAREALRASKARLAGIEEENQSLKEEVAKGRSVAQAREREVHDLEMQLDCLTKSKQMFQAVFALRQKAAATCGKEVKEKEKEAHEAQHMESEMRQSLQAAAQQLYSMNERVESMMDKLSERDRQLQEARAEKSKKDEVIRGLEQSLSNLTRTVDSQSACLMRLSAQNEHLVTVSQSQVRRIEELQTQIVATEERRDKADEGVEQLKQQLRDWDQEMQAQDLNCQLLREKIGIMEADLRQCHGQVASLLQSRDELCAEREQLQHLLANTNNRVTELAHQLVKREEAIRLLETNLEDCNKEMSRGQEEISRILRERNAMQQEAEAMSREALRTSVEVEVLRRRVQQLDEDVLVRDGQISILRGSLEES